MPERKRHTDHDKNENGSSKSWNDGIFIVAKRDTQDQGLGSARG